MITDLVSKITSGTKAIDTFIETPQERQKTLDGRHSRDMNSDSWFAKSVRPIITMFTGFIWGITSMILLQKLYTTGFTGDQWTIVGTFYGLLSTPFGSCIGFYFSSRRSEKVAARNARTNLQLEKVKQQGEILRIKEKNRQERRQRRRERNKEDDEA